MLHSFLVRLAAVSLTGNRLLILAAAFLVVTANGSFHRQILAAYGWNHPRAGVLLTMPVMLGLTLLLPLGLIAFGRLAKPVVVFALLGASVAAYFMDNFGIVINDAMIGNIMQTQVAEAADLMTLRLGAYLLLLGVAPSIWVLRRPLVWRGWRIEVLSRLKLLGAALAVLVLTGLAFGDFYASFIREHRLIRSYANPGYPLYSAVKYAAGHLFPRDREPVAIVGADARRPKNDRHRELVVVVVGETARADRFSLNGYARQTNPELAKEDVISFTNVHACGTSTAVSVPCMFSDLGLERFSVQAASRRENVLDVIRRSGAYVLWLDNNSDAKGVADRVPYVSYRSPDVNPVCDEECRDIGMLARLREVIDERHEQDVVIVLHQMGNHGPAYFKRYPKTFERFSPVCTSNDLSRCSAEEIGNAYDNAILYTDHFLARIIAMLRHYDDRFETAMIYVSDHGESLGERGIFLHGLPRALSPSEQLHVPAIFWFGESFDELDPAALSRKRHLPITHDHVFHTLLGILEIQTADYRSELDILSGAKRPEKK